MPIIPSTQIPGQLDDRSSALDINATETVSELCPLQHSDSPSTLETRIRTIHPSGFTLATDQWPLASAPPSPPSVYALDRQLTRTVTPAPSSRDPHSIEPSSGLDMPDLSFLSESERFIVHNRVVLEQTWQDIQRGYRKRWGPIELRKLVMKLFHLGQKYPDLKAMMSTWTMDGNRSRSIYRSQRCPLSMGPAADQFPPIFPDVIRVGGTPGEGNQRGDEESRVRVPPSFAPSLPSIQSLHDPTSIIFSNDVYVREVWNVSVSGPTVANTQSNAAPPATEEALRDLKRKPVNKEMLGTEGKVECTICLDEMKEKDMATILPCKHWFHGDCVVRWLRKHNTCPICRTPPIEENHCGGHSSNSSNGRDHNGSSQPHEPPSGYSSGLLCPSAPLLGFAASSWFSGGLPDLGGSAGNVGSSPNRPFRASRHPSQSSSRFNMTLGSISSAQQERDHDRDSATSSEFSYADSRLQRFKSHSREHPGSSPQ